MSSSLRTASPDGEWVFDGERLRSSSQVVEPFTIDFFHRWTFARFLPSGVIAMAFESSQPWSDWGSYGERHWGVQVLAPTPSGEWDLVAFELGSRRHDETFAPLDIVWHPRGVLAWLHPSWLEVQVLAKPRGIIEPELVPIPGSATSVELEEAFLGSWTQLSLDDAGVMVGAIDAAGVDRFDLASRRRARDGGDWEPWW